MATIYEQTPGGLITTGDRTVSTFPSGLVRVDQGFTCATSSASAHRPMFAVGEPMPGDDDWPAVDGLYIATGPSEVRTTTGFTEFAVSAYGRTIKTAPETVMIPERVTDAYIDFSVWKTTGSIVIPSNTVMNIETLGIEFNDDLLFPFDITGKITLEEHQVSSVSEISHIPRPPYSFRIPFGFEGNWIEQPLILPKPPDGRVYKIDMTLNESTTSLYLSIKDPVLKYTAYRVFGKFMEVDFESTRTINPLIVNTL